MQEEHIMLPVKEQIDDILKIANQLPEQALSQKQKALIKTALLPDKTAIRIQSVMSILDTALENYSHVPDKNPICLSVLRTSLEKTKLIQFMLIGQTCLILSEVRTKAANLEVMQAADTSDIGQKARNAMNLLYDMHISSAVKAKAITDILLLLYDLRDSVADISILADIEAMTELVYRANGLMSMVL